MSKGRTATNNVRLTDRCHDRVSEQCRDGERLSDTIERALDALEREDQLPDAVTEALEA